MSTLLCKQSFVRFITIACVVLSVHSTANTQDSKPGQATGERIGTAFKAAINIALPGVIDTINAIWPDRNKSKKGTDGDVAKALETERGRLKNLVLQQIKGVNDVVVEIKLIDGMATNASKANTFVARTDGLLSVALSSDEQWGEVSRIWGNANIFLNRIVSIKPDDIYARVKDDTDSAELAGFLDNLVVAQSDAAAFLKAKNGSAMREPIQRISVALDGLRLKGTVRLSRLADDLSSMANVFEGSSSTAQTGQKPPPPPDSKVAGDDIQQLITERLSGSRKQRHQ